MIFVHINWDKTFLVIETNIQNKPLDIDDKIINEMKQLSNYLNIFLGLLFEKTFVVWGWNQF